jgi:hypothetical protein
VAHMHSSNTIPSHYARVSSVVSLELGTPRPLIVSRPERPPMRQACFLSARFTGLTVV